MNSDGTTGDVDQHNTTSESETVNGVTAVETTTDHEDDEWTSSDAASGVEVTLRSDGENTDVRVDVENDSLRCRAARRPSSGRGTWRSVPARP